MNNSLQKQSRKGILGKDAKDITKISGRIARHIDSRQFQDDDGVEDYYNFDNEVDNQIKIGSEVSLTQPKS